MRSLSAALTASLVLAVLGPATAEAALPAGGHSQQATARAVPTLHVRRQVTGLDHPWDVQPIGHGRLLFTQRDRATLSVWEDGHTRTVDFPSKQVWVSGETGLMSLAIDPKFAGNGRIYTCQGATPRAVGTRCTSSPGGSTTPRRGCGGSRSSSAGSPPAAGDTAGAGC